MITTGRSMGEEPQLALSPNPPYAPHIVYEDYLRGLLKYAYRDGSGWVIETVDERLANRVHAIAVDGNDIPITCYWIDGDSVVMARRIGGVWEKETIASGKGCSMALDSEYMPHVITYDHINGQIVYAAYDGSSWHSETVTDADGNRQLVLDAADMSHILYNADGAIMVASRNLEKRRFFPIVYRPPLVFGSILLEDGRCCIGGYAGEPMDIHAALEATSVFSDVIEMRISRLYGCADEGAMSQVPWVSFAPEVTLTFAPPIN